MVTTLVPCVRHSSRSLSVLQGGLTIMYSDASFQYSAIPVYPVLKRPDKVLTCSTNKMCFRAARWVRQTQARCLLKWYGDITVDPNAAHQDVA